MRMGGSAEGRPAPPVRPIEPIVSFRPHQAIGSHSLVQRHGHCGAGRGLARARHPHVVDQFAAAAGAPTNRIRSHRHSTHTPAHTQVRPASAQLKVNTSWFTVARGVAGAFAPAWAFPVFDVRLLRYEGSLFATCVCARCPFGVYLVQLTGDVTADGGIRQLRAWVTQKATTRLPWAQGRNHALFVGRRSAEHLDELMVQPWLGLTASFGTPLIQKQQVVCHRPRKGARRFRVRGIQSCATVPPQEVVRLDRLRNLAGKDLKRLVRSGEVTSWPNSTLVTAGFGNLELISNRTHGNALAVPGGHTISSTTHLVRSSGRGGCNMLVGVGHL